MGTSALIVEVQTYSETCFKLHGYAGWWHELQARKKREAPATESVSGQAAVAMVESELSLIPEAQSTTSTPVQGCGIFPGKVIRRSLLFLCLFFGCWHFRIFFQRMHNHTFVHFAMKAVSIFTTCSLVLWLVMI